MSHEKGIMYKLSIKLFVTGIVTTIIGVVFMIIMMMSFENLINLTYLSLTSLLFGAGLSQLIVGMFLRFKAGKNPYQRDMSQDMIHIEKTEDDEEIPDYSSQNL